MAAFCRFRADRFREDDEDMAEADLTGPPPERLKITFTPELEDGVPVHNSLTKGAQISVSRAALLATILGGILTGALALV